MDIKNNKMIMTKNEYVKELFKREKQYYDQLGILTIALYDWSKFNVLDMLISQVPKDYFDLLIAYEITRRMANENLNKIYELTGKTYELYEIYNF